MIKSIFFVGIGGLLGSVTRFLVSQYFGQPTKFPYATFIVNISGSFLIGLIAGLSERFSWTTETSLFLAVGFCGGFTTFSAFAIENIRLLQDKDYLTFLLYSAGSFVLGLLATITGLLLAKA